MKLFEKIPASFFSVLASPNREIYWLALVKLHELLEYDLNIPAEDYCVALSDLLSDRELVEENPDDEEEARLIRQPTGKERWILNRLKRAGWLDTEYRDGSFVEIVVPRGYADKIIRLLLELEKTETKEYNSLVFSTYSVLKQAYEDKSERMYEALLTARRNTAELLQDLKGFYNSIREYHQNIAQAVDVNQLLGDYYDSYKSLLDKVYHPIKTLDSLTQYRQPILDILTSLQTDEEMLNKAAARLVQISPGTPDGDAHTLLNRTIEELLDSYAALDEILAEIDRKHSAYTRELGDSIKYRMSADHSTAGKLAGLLQAAAGSTPGKPREEILQLLQSGIVCYTQTFADEASLWHPATRTRRAGIPTHKITAAPPEEEQALLDAFRAERHGQYSAASAWRYIGQALQGKAQISGEDLALKNDSDFIHLLVAAVRSGEKNAPYTVELLDGESVVNGYRIPRMTIRRKSAAPTRKEFDDVD